MKFLTIGNYKDAFYTLPQAERQKVLVPQTEYNLEMKKKLGDKFHLYTVPGGNKIVFILDVDTLEDLSAFFRQAPVVQAGYFHIESLPLIEADVKWLEARAASVKKGQST